MLLAPLVGALVAREFKLPASTARSVAFSSSTGNSLVVLPLALALPEEIRGLAATAVITQTLIECNRPASTISWQDRKSVV